MAKKMKIIKQLERMEAAEIEAEIDAEIECSLIRVGVLIHRDRSLIRAVLMARQSSAGLVEVDAILAGLDEIVRWSHERLIEYRNLVFAQDGKKDTELLKFAVQLISFLESDRKSAAAAA